MTGKLIFVRHPVGITRAVVYIGMSFLAFAAQAESFSATAANTFVHSKDYQGLLRYSQAWTKAEPSSAQAWSYLGVVYGIYLNQPSNAVAPMQKSLTLDPSQAPGWHALGVTFLQLKRNADAVNAMLDPVRERYAAIRDDEAALEAIFAAGAVKARAITSETLRDVRRAMGIGVPGA